MLNVNIETKIANYSLEKIVFYLIYINKVIEIDIRERK